MRELIVEGAFAANQRLMQSDLSEQLGVGRTPVREALNRLMADGLVISQPNRGVVIAPAPLESAEELYAIRLLLEPPLVQALTTDFGEAEFERMEAKLEEMEASPDRTVDFQKAHRDFHLVSISEYTNKAIADMVMRVHRQLFRYQQQYMSRPRVPEDFVELDRALLEAMREGDARRARDIFEFHLIDAAVGLVLDVDPDHAFDPLLVAMRGAGILIETDEARMQRPAAISWADPAPDLPPMKTFNLVYAPAASAPRRRR
ncbi:MAG: GntR family transcriptional regulator [Actinobacteria bacterium]|nr:GntR family transcriptional regulator [Actinomycetota bacterium]